jgi:hypothetical protein
MKRIIFILLLSSSLHAITAQVGIGTTSPNPSAVLDINSSDQGLLIPRVALGDVSDTMLDGTNTAATGLLIWNTNASVTGGNGVGYYSFNGTNWEKVRTSADSAKVVLKVSSTTASSSIPQGGNFILFLNSISYNSGGGSYDTSTGTYTVPADGLYEIRTSFNVNLAAPNYEMLMSNRVWLNGVYYMTTLEQRTEAVDINWGITYSTTFVEQFSNGDQLQLFSTNVTPTSTAVYGGASTAGRGTWLVIRKID